MLRQKIGFLFQVFSMITSCMVIVVALFTTVIHPTERISPAILWQIAAVAAATTLPILIFSWDRSMGKAELVVRTLIYYILVNVIVLVSGLMFEWYSPKNVADIVWMLIFIAAVFALVYGISWSKSVSDAKRMNERLSVYAKKSVDNLDFPMYNESVCEEKTR